jgi:hypothetical protein
MFINILRAYIYDWRGKNPDFVEETYKNAITKYSNNIWLREKLILFYIDQALFQAAYSQWSDTCKLFREIDAATRFTAFNNLVKLNDRARFHRSIANKWLDYGQVEQAREVFNHISPTISSHSIQDLHHRLEDSEEARILGESVYPFGMPMKDRWMVPHIVPLSITKDSVYNLEYWYPGRIVDNTNNTITIVIATTESDLNDRRVLVKEIPFSEWSEKSDIPIDKANGFIEVGCYEDGSVKIYPVTRYKNIYKINSKKILRYLRDWNH